MKKKIAVFVDNKYNIETVIDRQLDGYTQISEWVEVDLPAIKHKELKEIQIDSVANEIEKEKGKLFDLEQKMKGLLDE